MKHAQYFHRITVIVFGVEIDIARDSPVNRPDVNSP